MRLLIMIFFIIPLGAFAQDDPAAKLEILDKIMGWIPDAGAGTGVIALTVIVELILRVTKTKEPKSVVYVISGGITKVGKILLKLGELLDKVLPQRTK